MTDDDNKTLWCGNISEQVSEEILYELFLQAGPLEKVRIPRERDGRQKNFAFITYHHEVSVPYALALLRGTALFHRTLTLQCRARMAPLPPPIRCNSLGLDHPFEFQANPNVRQQFEEMTQRNDIHINNQDHFDLRQPAQQNDLVMASLQGNWSHRHHPYDRTRDRPDRRQRRDNFDNHHEDDHGNAYNKQQRDGGWRERQNNIHSGRYSNRKNYNRRN